MNIEYKKSEMNIMSIMSALMEKEILSDTDIVSFIGNVNSMISEYRNRFLSLPKSENISIQECEDVSGMIIDLAHSTIVASINSLELPEIQINRMKRYFCKTMMSKSEFLNEAFSWSFTIQFWNNYLKSKKSKSYNGN